MRPPDHEVRRRMGIPKVLSGLDRIHTADALLKGRRLGLLTNQTGVDRAFLSAAEILYRRYDLCALFAPEHGLRGNLPAEQDVPSGPDPDTGVMVYSVFSGGTRAPAREMLEEIDLLVYDIQDVGARFYTFLYSLANAMIACARAGKPLLVLDRPNPLGGGRVAGTVIQPGFESFEGGYALPSRYGLTPAEYARYLKAYLGLDLELHWVVLEGWDSEIRSDVTGLPWIPPSPGLPHFTSALCYVGTGVLEGTNLSVGRGTGLPFEQAGAPWLDARTVESEMNRLALTGVRFRRTSFVPGFGRYAGEECFGVQLHVTEPAHFSSFEAGLLLTETVWCLHPDRFAFLAAEGGRLPEVDRILGTDAFRTGAMSARELIRAHEPLVRAFRERAREFYLY